MGPAISRPRGSAVKPRQAGGGAENSKVVAATADETTMTRALLSALLLAIPFLTSVILVKRGGHPSVG